MGQTDLLEDLVGLAGPLDKGKVPGLQGEDLDEDLEIGSDYPYANELGNVDIRN